MMYVSPPIDMNILDEILDAFFTQYPLSSLQDKPSDFFDSPVHMNYTYTSLGCIATVYNYKTLDSQLVLNRQLTIKLSSDKFSYSTQTPLYWDIAECSEKMPFLTRLKSERSIELCYCYNNERIDIKIESCRKPSTVVIFDSGHPVFV